MWGSMKALRTVSALWAVIGVALFIVFAAFEGAVADLAADVLLGEEDAPGWLEAAVVAAGISALVSGACMLCALAHLRRDEVPDARRFALAGTLFGIPSVAGIFFCSHVWYHAGKLPPAGSANY